MGNGTWGKVKFATGNLREAGRELADPVVRLESYGHLKAFGQVLEAQCAVVVRGDTGGEAKSKTVSACAAARIQPAKGFQDRCMSGFCDAYFVVRHTNIGSSRLHSALEAYLCSFCIMLIALSIRLADIWESRDLLPRTEMVCARMVREFPRSTITGSYISAISSSKQAGRVYFGIHRLRATSFEFCASQHGRDSL